MGQRDFDSNNEINNIDEDFSLEKLFAEEKENSKPKNRIGPPILAAVFILMFGVTYFLALKTGIITKVRSAGSNDVSVTTADFSLGFTKIETTTVLETTRATETTTEKALQTKNYVSTSTNNKSNANDTEKVISFYKNAVFVGDSLMDGFEKYVAYQGGNYLGRPNFLAATSFSIFNALKPVSSNSVHPMYKGKRHLVEDSIAMMEGVDKVFLFFGANDVGYGVDYSVDNYKVLIERIQRKSPEIKIFIISAMYMAKQSETDGLNNKRLSEFNDKMALFCKEKNYGFVEIASHLGNKDNGILMKYSSDNYVHINISGYKIWSSLLRNYAENYELEVQNIY